MTVSPQPQDGSASASQRAGAKRVDPSHSSEPLPPTLFALPNLRHEAAHVSMQEKSISAKDLSPGDAAPSTISASPKVIASTERAVTDSLESKITRHDQPVANRVPDGHQSIHRHPAVADPASYAESNDQASLLDRISSHVIVLAMLLVVFGIALLAGRKPIIESTTPVATQTDNSVSPQVDSPNEIPDAEAIIPELAVAAVVDTSVGALTGPVNEAISTATEIQSVTSPMDALQLSATTQPSIGLSASTISAKSTNRSESESTPIDALSNQTHETLPPRESTSDTPTHDLHSSVGTVQINELLTESTASASGYQYSKTPQSINDWSRYLKPLESSYITPSSTVTTQP